MSAELKIRNLGFTASNDPFRATRDGHEFVELMPAPDWHEKIVERNGIVKDTVREMKKLIQNYAWQTKSLAKKLEGKNLYDTSKNIWQFLYDHFKYKEDDEGKEQLRTPALSWAIRTKRGIDCDDFSIFAGTLFYNLGIPFYLRIAHYPEFDHFSHVYVIVPSGNKKYIVVDAVLDSFDTEKEPIVEHQDFLVMSKEHLNGIDISVLSGISTDTDKEIVGLIMGAGFPEDELSGVALANEQLEAVFKHLVATRDLIRNTPSLIKNHEDPHSFLKMLDYAIQYWHTDKRDEALAILEAKEKELNEMEGLSEEQKGYEVTKMFYGISDLGGLSVLGKTSKLRAFFSEVKNVVKKTGDAIKTDVHKAGEIVKNAFKGLVKYNPLTVSARAGMLLALKLNLNGIAEKLKWGYLTEAEAKKHGFDLGEWRKVNIQLLAAQNLFVNTMQGNAGNFKDAILRGRAGGLSGFSENLGADEGDSQATLQIIAAAMPYIKKLFEMLKNIDFSKLIKGVKPQTLEAGRKEAEQQNPIPPEVQQQLPAINDTIATPSSTDNTPAKTDTPPPTPPAKTDTNDTPPPTPPKDEPSVFSKIGDWVKDNPGKSALIGAGGLILGFAAFSTRSPRLSGVGKKGKKKKGGKKSHPPKAISGAGKKKGKGGGGKKVHL